MLPLMIPEPFTEYMDASHLFQYNFKTGILFNYTMAFTAYLSMLPTCLLFTTWDRVYYYQGRTDGRAV